MALNEPLRGGQRGGRGSRFDGLCRGERPMLGPNSQLDKKKQAGAVCGISCGCYLIVGGLLQVIMFHWALGTLFMRPHRCSASALSDYDWNDAEESTFFTKSDNMVPEFEMIIEQPYTMYGKPYAVYQSNEQQTAGALIGQWYRTYGPWFWTYTFQDNEHAQFLMYMRPTVAGMFFFKSFTIRRCDGEASPYVVSEGMGWISNRLRKLFQLASATRYKIFLNGDEVGYAEEQWQASNKALTYRNHSMENGVLNEQRLGSALQHPNNHGEGTLDEFFLNFETDTAIPFYVMNAFAARFAYAVNDGEEIEHARHPPPTPKPRAPAFVELEEQEAANLEDIEKEDETPEIEKDSKDIQEDGINSEVIHA